MATISEEYKISFFTDFHAPVRGAMSIRSLFEIVGFILLPSVMLFACSPTQEVGLTPTASPLPSSTPTLVPRPTPTPTPAPVWSITTEHSTAFSINAMTLDLEENIWTTGWGGVLRWDIENGGTITYGHEQGMPGFEGVDIMTDAQGGVWRYFEGQWFHYDASNGLASDFVRDFAAAEDGKVWISTDGGISCFDAGTWTTYMGADGLPSEDVGVIAAGKDGVIWAHTSEGVTSFDGGTWMAYDGRMKSVNVEDIHIMPDGQVWFATSKHFYRYDGAEFTYYQPPDGARLYHSFEVARDGTLWAQGAQGLAAWRNSQWVVLLEDDGFPIYSANGMLATRDGALWLTTKWDGLVRLSNWRLPASGAWQATVNRYCTSQLGVKVQGTMSIEEMQKETCLDDPPYLGRGQELEDGRLVFISSSDILILMPSGEYQRFSLPTIEWEGEKELEPRPYDTTYGDDHSLWRLGGSLYKFNGLEWQSLSQEDPFFKSIELVKTGPDGRVWVVGNFAISVWDGESWTHWPEELDPEKPEDIRVNALDFDGEDVWMGDRERGVSKLVAGDLEHPQWEVLGLPDWDHDNNALGITNLQIDSQGGVWAVGMYGMPAYYDGSEWHIHPQDDYRKISVTSMVLAPDESLWLAFYDKEMDWSKAEYQYDYYFMRYDGGEWQPIGEGARLPQARINQIVFAPDDVIWVGYSDHGVAKFNPLSDSWEVFNTANIFDNSDLIYDLIVDESGVIWVRLGDGYARYGPPLEGAQED